MIEFGSNFHICLNNPSHESLSFPNKATFWGSGRDALAALFLHLIKEKKSETVWLPTYYCGSVVEKILTRKDLEQAEKVYVGNSVRGLVQVSLATL